MFRFLIHLCAKCVVTWHRAESGVAAYLLLLSTEASQLFRQTGSVSGLQTSSAALWTVRPLAPRRPGATCKLLSLQYLHNLWTFTMFVYKLRVRTIYDVVAASKGLTNWGCWYRCWRGRRYIYNLWFAIIWYIHKRLRVIPVAHETGDSTTFST